MDLVKLRFALSVGALFMVSTLAILVLFFGVALTSVQVGLLTLFGSAVISELKSSSSYVFDGTPDKTTSKEPQ